MIAYRLPKTVNVDGAEYEINSGGDFRAILDVLCVFEDKELTVEEQQYGALCLFYNFDIPSSSEKAVEEFNKFIDCGCDESQQTSDDSQDIGRIMSWEKDFGIICDDINAKYGIDIRGLDYLHWWTFMSYYKCLGEGQFNTIIGIRKKLKKHTPLEKWEQEYYNSNKHKVDLDGSASVFSKEEEDFLEFILGG